MSAHRASMVASTFSLVDPNGRNASALGGEQSAEAQIHTAPPRSETAMLQPVSSHQFEGGGIGTMLHVRFRPESVSVLHRDGGVDTFLRPGIPLSALTGQPEGGLAAENTTSDRPVSSGGLKPSIARSRGLSFGFRKASGDAVAAK